MVFFQAALLAGYAYAHWGPKLLGPRIHAIVHVLLVAGSFAFLPFAISQNFNPAKSGLAPEWTLLMALAAAVGLPYLLVSAGAPLVQRWFASTSDPNAKSPYFLYAASNFGSLAALLAYPFLIDGSLDLRSQSRIWAIGFGVLGGLLVACQIFIARPAAVKESLETIDSPNPTTGQKLRWLVLAAVPSSLMLGVTTHITTNIASIPLLWVIPLSVYLLTFVIAFSKRFQVGSEKIGRWAALIIAPMCLILLLEANEPFWLISLLHLTMFFLVALFAHRELAETVPDSDHLTEFYFMLSIGGVIGGIFNALLAPRVFVTVAEYPIALIAAMILRWKPSESKFNLSDLAMVTGVGILTVSMALLSGALKLPPTGARTALTMGVPAIAAFLCLERPLRYACAVGAFLVMANYFAIAAGGKIHHAERSFFGISRILEREPGVIEYVHGTTVHGRQTKGENPPTPQTYYHPSGPIGQLIVALQERDKATDCGLVGLGVGSLAHYGRPGDNYVFFEIDPAVIRIAQDENYFTFLSTSRASLRYVEGDARLSLLNEPDGSFDLLVVDAFSSDAIPIHLITLEALQTYRSKTKPGGVVALHISNRYLNLSKLLAGACKFLDADGRFWADENVTPEEIKVGKTPSQWFLIGTTPDSLRFLDRDVRWSKLHELASIRPWTDARSNLLEVWDWDQQRGEL